MKAHAGLAVTVTLVFADEIHRERWLERCGFIPRERPDEVGRVLAGETVVVEPPEKCRIVAQRVDYETRKGNTNLAYHMGPEGR